MRRPPPIVRLLPVPMLLLAGAAAVAWVYSYCCYDTVGFWPSPARRVAYGVLSHHGTVCFVKVAEGDVVSRWKWLHRRSRSPELRLRGVGGFLFRRERGETLGGVPYRVLCLLAAAPALALARRRRPRGPGLCPACGYDLRATPERCPDCGRAPAREAVARARD